MPAPPSVLVVEDHEDTRELYMTCLSLEGFEVRGAADGAEGLAQVRKHRPDLVLLDFALPRMNGAEVLREIRGDPELSRTPVVLVSAQMRLCLAEVKGLAFQAALCLRDKQNQVIGANVGGVPPTIASLYNDPALYADYPFHADILSALENASVRPQTPFYQVVSIGLSHQISPPTKIKPAATEQSMVSQINNALASKGLVP